MGLKDHKLFPMEQISVTKIQGRTITREDDIGVGFGSAPLVFEVLAMAHYCPIYV